MANQVAVKRDFLGSMLGLIVFGGGIVLLLATFQLAYGMFNVPPRDALGLEDGKPIEINPVVSTVTGLVFRILLLLVMGVLGSLVANKGVHMYTESRGLKGPKPAPAEE